MKHRFITGREDMTFISYCFKERQDAYIFIALVTALSTFYMSVNNKIIQLLHTGYTIQKGPFLDYPFTFNIFNFDPVIFQGQDGSIISHPFIRIISFPLQFIASLGNENMIMLVIQSIVLGITAGFIYLYCRKLTLTPFPALLVTIIFGISSYSLVTSFIPDSYPYAQFFIVLSVLYFQYINEYSRTSSIYLGIFGVINFGITSTNVIPYAVNTLLSKLGKNKQEYTRILISSISYALGLLIILMIVDKLFFPGTSWFENIGQGLSSKGTIYTDSFSWEKHYPILFSLFIAPFVFPNLMVQDPTNLVAVVTDLAQPFTAPSYIIGLAIIGLSLIGIALNIKQRDIWILVTFLLFNSWLHLIKGFGLATYTFDMFLYAGHYMFAITLGIAWLMKSAKCNKQLNVLLMCGLLIIICIQLVTNYNGITDLHTLLKQTYIE
jgi:Family of unknown function (DUF6080)